MRLAFKATIIVLAVGVLILILRHESNNPEKEEIAHKSTLTPPPATNAVSVIHPEQETPPPPAKEAEASSDEPTPWWHEPTYSNYEYDPTLAVDPDYRKLVTHHLFLDAFYKSPVRLEEPFQELISMVENWSVVAEEEIELLVHANNMAFRYHAAQRHYHDETGIVSTREDRERAKWHRDFTVNNMKETFDYLFEGYEGANFEDLTRIKPSAIFPYGSMRIEPGTRLISN